MADIQSAAAEIRRGKKERKKKEEQSNYRPISQILWKYNGLPYSIERP